MSNQILEQLIDAAVRKHGRPNRQQITDADLLPLLTGEHGITDIAKLLDYDRQTLHGIFERRPDLKIFLQGQQQRWAQYQTTGNKRNRKIAKTLVKDIIAKAFEQGMPQFYAAVYMLKFETGYEFDKLARIFTAYQTGISAKKTSEQEGMSSHNVWLIWQRMGLDTRYGAQRQFADIRKLDPPSTQ